MSHKAEVLDVHQKIGDLPALPSVTRGVARRLVRRGLFEFVREPGLIRRLAKPRLKMREELPKPSLIPYLGPLPSAEVSGCIFEDPTARRGQKFLIQAARIFADGPKKRPSAREILGAAQLPASSSEAEQALTL